MKWLLILIAWLWPGRWRTPHRGEATEAAYVKRLGRGPVCVIGGGSADFLLNRCFDRLIDSDTGQLRDLDWLACAEIRETLAMADAFLDQAVWIRARMLAGRPFSPASYQPPRIVHPGIKAPPAADLLRLLGLRLERQRRMELSAARLAARWRRENADNPLGLAHFGAPACPHRLAAAPRSISPTLRAREKTTCRAVAFSSPGSPGEVDRAHLRARRWGQATGPPPSPPHSCFRTPAPG